MHFSSASSYVLFADTNNNKQYDDGTGSAPADTIVSVYTLANGNSIKHFCGLLVTGTAQCSDTNAIDKLDIMFFRPDPDALITSANPGQYSEGIVTVQSSAGTTRTITVASTGQISVTNP